MHNNIVVGCSSFFFLQSSDDLVQAANELLRDKENPEKKRALLDALEEARDAINAANVPMTSLKEMVDNLEGNKTYEKKSYDAYGVFFFLVPSEGFLSKK